MGRGSLQEKHVKNYLMCLQNAPTTAEFIGICTIPV
jgi:hypothetical protein